MWAACAEAYNAAGEPLAMLDLLAGIPSDMRKGIGGAYQTLSKSLLKVKHTHLLSNYIVAPSDAGPFHFQLHSNHIVTCILY